MSNIPSKVQAFLNSHDLSALEFEPGSTPTAEKAAQRIGVPVGQIAKSILFKGKDDKYFNSAGAEKISNAFLTPGPEKVAAVRRRPPKKAVRLRGSRHSHPKSRFRSIRFRILPWRH